MSGGRGDLATTEESKKLDGDLRSISKQIATWYEEHFIRKNRLTPT